MRPPLWLALALLPAINAASDRVFTTPFPSPASMRLGYEDAVRSVGLMSLGMRRLAADLAFIRLLMYYGSPETDHEHGHDYGGGHYPKLAEQAIRILDLDPFFEYAVQYASSALAFNLQRPDEALEVLRRATDSDPRNWKYRSYVAAIGFHKKGSPEKVREELAPVADDPEAPTMLKHMLAFLNRRLGRREDAIRLYREILRSRDTDYHGLSREALRQMGAPEEP